MVTLRGFSSETSVFSLLTTCLNGFRIGTAWSTPPPPGKKQGLQVESVSNGP